MGSEVKSTHVSSVVYITEEIAQQQIANSSHSSENRDLETMSKACEKKHKAATKAVKAEVQTVKPPRQKRPKLELPLDIFE